MKSPTSPTKPDIDDLQHQFSQQRRNLETYKAENKALKDEIEARTKVFRSMRCCMSAEAVTFSRDRDCVLQQEQYIPSTLQQEQLGQLTDLLDVFKRKVHVKAADGLI